VTCGSALGDINNHEKEARKDLPHLCFYYIISFAGCSDGMMLLLINAPAADE